jgi:hypothetical protein
MPGFVGLLGFAPARRRVLASVRFGFRAVRSAPSALGSAVRVGVARCLAVIAPGHRACHSSSCSPNLSFQRTRNSALRALPLTAELVR